MGSTENILNPLHGLDPGLKCQTRQRTDQGIHEGKDNCIVVLDKGSSFLFTDYLPVG